MSLHTPGLYQFHRTDSLHALAVPIHGSEETEATTVQIRRYYYHWLIVRGSCVGSL